jgi:vancomycin permeability regulator SanA
MKTSFRINKTIKWLIILLAAWLGIQAIYVTCDGLHSYAGNADIAIVLGNTVRADSSLSPWLKGRVDKALELYRQGRVREIMVSGGKGEYGVPEGFAMERYLLQRRVPANRIIADNDGNNTYLTAKDFLALNETRHFASAIVVTSFYHITRAKYIIRKLGFENVHGVSSDAFFWQDGYGLFRDCLAFYKYVFLY